MWRSLRYRILDPYTGIVRLYIYKQISVAPQSNGEMMASFTLTTSPIHSKAGSNRAL